MGKNSKRSSAEQLQEYRRKREQEELEKQKRQNRILMWIFIGILALVLVVAAVGIISHYVQQKDEVKPGNSSDKVELKDPVIDETNADFTTASGETDFVRLTVRYVDKNKVYRQGEIIVNLRADIAPITVANFKKLVGEDFYDGLTFHRIMSGFMIQGGDPKGDGTGGSGTEIKGEFAANGVENDLSHTRGVISMARGSHSMDSASSQFFIMHADNTGLDGKYAAFGKVVSGMDTVDGIAGTPVTYNSGGELAAPINEVTLVSAEFVERVK